MIHKEAYYDFKHLLPMDQLVLYIINLCVIFSL